jgi:hypothetical protein
MENLIIGDSSNLIMNVKPTVSIKNSISIAGSDTELPVEIVADFTNIPQHLHGIYLSALDSKYNSDLRIWENIESRTPEPKTIEEKKRDWRLNKIVDIFCSKF